MVVCDTEMNQGLFPGCSLNNCFFYGTCYRDGDSKRRGFRRKFWLYLVSKWNYQVANRLCVEPQRKIYDWKYSHIHLIFLNLICLHLMTLFCFGNICFACLWIPTAYLLVVLMGPAGVQVPNEQRQGWSALWWVRDKS